MKKFMKTLGILAGLPILYLIINIVLVFISYIVINSNIKSPESFIKFIYSSTLPLYLITGLIMLLIIFLLLKKKVIPPCKFNRINLGTIFYILIFCFGTFIFIDLLENFLTTIFPSSKEVYTIFESTNISLLKLFIIVIFAPIFEEIFFRGLIFGYLKENYNLILSIILQALAFGIVHRDIIQDLYAFILGILLALIYFYTDSIYGAIIFHLVFNFLGCVISPILVAKYPHLTYILVALAIVCIIIPIIKIINTRSVLFRKLR